MSLNKLNQKWELTEKISTFNISFQEIVDLLLDHVLPPEDVAILLLSPSDEALEKIASHIHKHQHDIDKRKPYQILKQLNQQLLEIPDANTWLKSFFQEVDHQLTMAL